MLLGNVAKLQQALQTGDYDDLPPAIDATATTTNAGTNLPAMNAFFPFGCPTTTDAGAIGLGELLTMSGDLLADGSVFDGLSTSQGTD